MSDRQKLDAAEGLRVANSLMRQLEPHCERIVIAGSLRRGKAQVGDVELLFIPKMNSRQAGLFDLEPFNEAQEKIGELLRDGVLAKRPNVKGHLTWGDKNKLAIHVASGVPVDLFMTTAENWWTALVIRTGSKDMNLVLTNQAIAAGRTLNAYGSGVTINHAQVIDGTEYLKGAVIPATSEEHVFELCRVPYRVPRDR